MPPYILRKIPSKLPRMVSLLRFPQTNVAIFQSPAIDVCVTRNRDEVNGWQACLKEPSSSEYEIPTDLYDAQNERAVLEVVLETEVDLANILARFRIIDVHIDQGDGPAL